MFTDEIFGFKKLEDGKWEVKTFSFYRMCRYGMKEGIYKCIILERYKKIVKYTHTSYELMCLPLLLVCGGRCHGVECNNNCDQIYLIFLISLILYLMLINFLTNYYVHKSNEHSTTK